MLSNKPILLKALPILVSLSLTACGGGGGSGSTSSNTSTTQTTTVSGIAAKGLIKNGIVTATDASGTIVYGTATTDDKGQYQITLKNYVSGPVLLSVSAGANTQMQNEANGDAFENFPAGLVLRSALSDIQAGNTANAAITPLTEVAMARAVAAATAANRKTLSSVDIDTGRASVSYWFGLDPVSTSPNGTVQSNLDKSKAVLYYALLKAIRADAGDVSQVKNKIDVLEDALEDGKLTDTEKSAIKGIATQLSQDASASQEASLSNFSSEVEKPGDSTESLPDSTTQGALSQAKALFGDIRNTALTIKDMQNSQGVIDTEAKQAEQTLTNTALPNVGSVVENISFFKGLMEGMKQAETAGQTSYTTYYYRSGMTSSISVVITKNASGYTYSMGNNAWQGSITPDSTGLGLSVDGTLPADQSILAKSGLDKELLKATLSATPTTTGDVMFSANATLTDYNADNTEMATASLTNLKWTGVKETYTYSTGNTQSSYDYYLTKPESAALSISIPGRYTLVGTLDFSNYAENASFAQKYPYTHVPMPIFGYVRTTSKGLMFTSVTFNGKLSNLQSNAYLEGAVTLDAPNFKTMDFMSPESDTNFLQVNTSVSGKLQLPGRPLMTLTTSLSRDTLSSGAFKVGYSFNGITVNADGRLYDKAPLDTPQAILTLTNQVGTRLELEIMSGGDVVGFVSKDGTKLGTIEKRFNAPAVKYVDGTFTTLM